MRSFQILQPVLPAAAVQPHRSGGAECGCYADRLSHDGKAVVLRDLTLDHAVLGAIIILATWPVCIVANAHPF